MSGVAAFAGHIPPVDGLFPGCQVDLVAVLHLVYAAAIGIMKLIGVSVADVALRECVRRCCGPCRDTDGGGWFGRSGCFGCKQRTGCFGCSPIQVILGQRIGDACFR